MYLSQSLYLADELLHVKGDVVLDLDTKRTADS